jgi:hypothetical protein
VVQRTGLVLIELLVAVLLVTLLGSWLSYRLPSNLAADARLLAGAVAQARARAAVGTSMTTVFGETCSPPPLTALVGLTRAKVVAPARGLQFTPDGLPRTCDGGGVGNTTILLEHRGRQAAVIVSSLGRVRWELR